MKRAYAVVAGCYSDYRVLAVFESEADAIRWAETARLSDSWHDDARVEALPYIPAGAAAPVRVIRHTVSAVLWDDGRVTRNEGGDVPPHTYASDEWDYELPEDSRPRVRWVRAPCHAGKAGRLEAEGSDLQACLEVVSDRIAMFKAGAWNPRAVKEQTWTDEPPHAP